MVKAKDSKEPVEQENNPQAEAAPAADGQLEAAVQECQSAALSCAGALDEVNALAEEVRTALKPKSPPTVSAPLAEPSPTLGRVVHFHDRHHYGTEPLAAIVTRAGGSDVVDLHVCVPEGMKAFQRVPKGGAKPVEGRSAYAGPFWTWPPRA